MRRLLIIIIIEMIFGKVGVASAREKKIQRKWVTNFDSIVTDVVIGNNYIYFGTFGGSVVAIDKKTGRTVCRNRDTNNPIIDLEVNEKGTVIVRAQKSYKSIESSTCMTLWEFHDAIDSICCSDEECTITDKRAIKTVRVEDGAREVESEFNEEIDVGECLNENEVVGFGEDRRHVIWKIGKSILEIQRDSDERVANCTSGANVLVLSTYKGNLEIYNKEGKKIAKIKTGLPEIVPFFERGKLYVFTKMINEDMGKVVRIEPKRGLVENEWTSVKYLVRSIDKEVPPAYGLWVQLCFLTDDRLCFVGWQKPGSRQYIGGNSLYSVGYLGNVEKYNYLRNEKVWENNEFKEKKFMFVGREEISLVYENGLMHSFNKADGKEVCQAAIDIQDIIKSAKLDDGFVGLNADGSVYQIIVNQGCGVQGSLIEDNVQDLAHSSAGIYMLKKNGELFFVGKREKHAIGGRYDRIINGVSSGVVAEGKGVLDLYIRDKRICNISANEKVENVVDIATLEDIYLVLGENGELWSIAKKDCSLKGHSKTGLWSIATIGNFGLGIGKMGKLYVMKDGKEFERRRTDELANSIVIEDEQYLCIRVQENFLRCYAQNGDIFESGYIVEYFVRDAFIEDDSLYLLTTSDRIERFDINR